MARPRRASSVRPRKSNEGLRSSDRDRTHHHSFRLRAKKLLDQLTVVVRDVRARLQSPHSSTAHSDAEVNATLDHFDKEMRALRVMLKSKDVLIDPENAWKSASRIKAPYNAAIRICLQSGRVDRAFKLLNQMKKDGIFPGATTYTVLFNGLAIRLIAQEETARLDRNPQALLQRKEVQLAREVYQDLEKLWKQAFPRYFQPSTSGTHRLGSPPSSKDVLETDTVAFHKLSEQARRNLVSQQASVKEAREFPKVLSNAIGAYLGFLRLVGFKQEMQMLFDRLFPLHLIDTMTKGLDSNASPQDRLETANRRLADCLPLGDVSTLSAFLVAVKDSHDPDRLATVERVWTTLAKLMDLERHESLTTPQTKSKDHQMSKILNKGLDKLAKAGPDTDAHVPRFVPDDQLMIDIFNRLQPLPDADPAPEIRLGLSILSKVYSLDLQSAADGIVRDPQLIDNAEKFGFARFLAIEANAIPELSQPIAELRDPTTASCIQRLLSRPEAGKQCIAFFNYLWARAHAEHQKAAQNASAPESTHSDTAVFGSALRPTTVLSLLWLLVVIGDPVGARVIIEAMKRADAATSAEHHSKRGKPYRMVGHSKPIFTQSDISETHDWKPNDLAYLRAMRANLAALVKAPGGLTAVVLHETRSKEADSAKLEASKPSKYDAWAESKSLFNEWCDYGDTGGPGLTQARWGAVKLHATDRSESSSRRRGSSQDARLEQLARIQAETMCSLLLQVAQLSGKQQRGKGADIAREALRLLNERIGLEQFASEAKRLDADVAALPNSNTFKGDVVPIHKVNSLHHLSKVIDLALDTSDHSFAPKADVELWKRLLKRLPAPSTSDSTETRSAVQKGPRDARKDRDVQSRQSGGNRLLLTRDDYLELEADESVEAEEDLAYETVEAGQGSRGSLRMQRRSRHVEQELQRWVKGAASSG